MKPPFTGTLPQNPGGVKTCFPSGYDTGDLREITMLTDAWAKFINIRTGEVVDCARFAQDMRDQIEVLP